MNIVLITQTSKVDRHYHNSYCADEHKRDVEWFRG